MNRHKRTKTDIDRHYFDHYNVQYLDWTWFNFPSVWLTVLNTGLVTCWAGFKSSWKWTNNILCLTCWMKKYLDASDQSGELGAMVANKRFTFVHCIIVATSYTLNSVGCWRSGKLPFECKKIAQNLTFFSKKLPKIVIFFNKCQWQFCWKKKDNFWQFFWKKMSFW